MRRCWCVNKWTCRPIRTRLERNDNEHWCGCGRDDRKSGCRQALNQLTWRLFVRVQEFVSNAESKHNKPQGQRHNCHGAHPVPEERFSTSFHWTELTVRRNAYSQINRVKLNILISFVLN